MGSERRCVFMDDVLKFIIEAYFSDIIICVLTWTYFHKMLETGLTINSTPN